MADQRVSDLRELPPAPGVKIIRAGDETAWRDGYRFLSEAKDAYEAERARGYADGMLAAQQSASRLIAETTEKVDRYLAGLERDVAHLAFDIVRRMLSEFDNAELVARAAHNALADLREAKAVRIEVHPNAESHVQEMLAAYAAEHGRDIRSITVQVDPGLDEGACILATDFAIVEATIDAQLAAIAQAMNINLTKP